MDEYPALRRLATYVKEQMERHDADLRGWEEPTGYLIPTEPDPAERGRIRSRLRGAIYELENVQERLDAEIGRLLIAYHRRERSRVDQS